MLSLNLPKTQIPYVWLGEGVFSTFDAKSKKLKFYMSSHVWWGMIRGGGGGSRGGSFFFQLLMLSPNEYA